MLPNLHCGRRKEIKIMNEKETQFSETEDTKLKQFLSGSRIYIMLAAAVICAIVFIPTFAAILGIYHNADQAKNVLPMSEIDLSTDLNGQYVTGSAYKFLTKLGYIAETDAAATEYYYLMYIDSPDGQQIATLVEADKRGDADIADIIKAYLAYAKDPEAGYHGNIVEIAGRFKSMSRMEEQMMKQGISKLGINSPVLGYTLKIGKLPQGKDTVPYWFLAVPVCIAMIVCTVLFIYGLVLEDKRIKANESPYPYYQKKNKK